MAAPEQLDIHMLPNGYLIDRRFIINGKLGQGATGSVYRVRDKNDMKEKALKITKLDRSGKKVFLAETSALTKLINLDGVPPLHHVKCDSKLQYFVADLYAGDLESLIKFNPDGAFSLETTLIISYHLFSVLQMVHGRKIIHRDLKMANMALKLNYKDCKNPIAIFDFGMSISVPNDTRPHKDPTYSICKYATPNMIQGDQCTRQDDCWMILYSILDMMGEDCFNIYSGAGIDGILARKKDFENRPMSYQEHGWIGELATVIKSKPGNEEQGYNRLRSIVKGAKRGFEASRGKLELKSDYGRMYL